MPKVIKQRIEPNAIATSVANAFKGHSPRPFERRILIKHGKRLASTIVRLPKAK